MPVKLPCGCPRRAAAEKGVNPKGRNGQAVSIARQAAGCKQKDLIGIPWLLAFALRADGWYLRSDIIWQKENPMPESVKDRPTRCYEHIFLLTKSKKYFYDAAAIAEPLAPTTAARYRTGRSAGQKYADEVPGQGKVQGLNRARSGSYYDEALMPTMRNRRDVWLINTVPYKGGHFAAFPPKLAETCIKAGCPKGGVVLGKYLASMGIPAFILPEKFTSGRSCFLPYIFTDSELKALFHVIDVQGGKENSLQPFLLSTVFRLIYTCGLRPNEGRMLKRESVNLATGEILITETKGHKERIVVMSDDMTELAASYARLRDAAYPDSPYFFPDRNGNSYSSPWMQNKFKAFFAAANPGVDPDMLPPVRIYDLRHRFASAALGRWLDNGENLFNRLPYLRAYMGHKELSATVYYIHLLPENLVKSAGIDWDSLRQMIPEVELWDE